ncbi:hypothetical protein [Staphylococcus massiliensis]|nr:hypothetical protein [Staphylococcus massiliensis]
MKQIWQIRSSQLNHVTLNLGEYTSIYNENETNEELILSLIYQYFQPRNRNKDVLIKELIEDVEVSSKSHVAFMISHNDIEQEHQLAASSILNKKLQYDMNQNIEVSGYINSINVLMEDLLEEVKRKLPLKVKPFDIKQFIKQLNFEYELEADYSRLIVRLKQLLPLLVEQMNNLSNNKGLLIYLYPEANLSIKERLIFREVLNDLPIKIIVLTQSRYFLADSIDGLNYLRNSKQMITVDFIENCYWEAPLNFKREDIVVSLKNVFDQYSHCFEIHPTITNYHLGDIMVFKDIDIYVIVRFLRFCKLDYILDIDDTKISEPLALYLGLSTS